MPCAETTRTEAYFDGETDALATPAIEAHVAHCAACLEHLENLRRLREALQRDFPFDSIPDPVRGRLLAALDRESDAFAAAATPGLTLVPASTARALPRRRNSFWTGAVTGFGAAAAAAGIAFWLVVPPLFDTLPDELAAAHARSLMPSHLIDVVSTDRHTVKPWFAGNADVSPVVADFESQGFRLVGGRADYFDHQRAAVIVYRHGSHVLNVFSWEAGRHPLPKNTTRGGYHLAFWQSGDLAYCAVSDAGWDETLALTRLLQSVSDADTRPP